MTPILGTPLTRLAHICAYASLGGYYGKPLPGLAAEAIEAGADIDGIGYLASFSNTTSFSDLAEPLRPIFRQFGLAEPSTRPNETAFRLTAAGIGAQDIDIFQGCRTIADAYLECSEGLPVTLAVFLVLAEYLPSAPTSDRSLGTTANDKTLRTIARVSREFAELGVISLVEI